MIPCFLASDLHGHTDRYEKLIAAIERDRPAALFLGGDLMPHGLGYAYRGDFVGDFLIENFRTLRDRMGKNYPEIFLILGNDDARSEEKAILEAETAGLWHYCHMRRVEFGDFTVYGYAAVPPTPFRLKDWERYDVSRFVDPGSISPEEGRFTVETSRRELKFATIADDLQKLTGTDNLERSIGLFHAPPYQSKLDRAALDGKTVDHVPLDVHIGSIAVRRFIEERQPLLTLHGHVHESARLTGAWSETIGRTVCLSAAHDGPELCLVRFDPEKPAEASRELL